jgi:hypothetical protein
MSFGRLWFSRKKWEEELSEEMRDHIERQTAVHFAAGMSALCCNWALSKV